MEQVTCVHTSWLSPEAPTWMSPGSHRHIHQEGLGDSSSCFNTGRGRARLYRSLKRVLQIQNSTVPQTGRVLWLGTQEEGDFLNLGSVTSLLGDFRLLLVPQTLQLHSESVATGDLCQPQQRQSPSLCGDQVEKGYVSCHTGSGTMT